MREEDAGSFRCVFSSRNPSAQNIEVQDATLSLVASSLFLRRFSREMEAGDRLEIAEASREGTPGRLERAPNVDFYF